MLDSTARTATLPKTNQAAAIGAAAGAAAWAAVVYFANYEIGWLAWGIGGLVGYAGAVAGGRGTNMALTCAGLALVSIFAGKIVATQMSVNDYLDGEFPMMLEEQYSEWKKDSDAFALLPEEATNEQLENYMFEHDYDLEIADFRADVAPQLREFAASDTSLEEWTQPIVEDARSQISVIEIVKDELNLLDILFAFFGISTAYGLIARATAADEQSARARARGPRSETAAE